LPTSACQHQLADEQDEIQFDEFQMPYFSKTLIVREASNNINDV